MLKLATTVATTAAAALVTAPDMCVTYFNFTDQQESNTYYGVVNDDGSILQKSDLGLQFDPQGRVAIGKETFVFTTNSNQTSHQGFGCCDKLSLLTVDKKTGSFSVASVDHTSQFGPGSKQCGEYGCGISSFSGIDDVSGTAVVWMDQLLPQPPPAASPQEKGDDGASDKQPPNPYLEGLTLGKFNLKTGEIIPLRPFFVNTQNSSVSTPMDSGMASYDYKNKDFWFSCNVDGDMNQEAVCSYPATSGKKAKDISVYSWAYDKTYTINSIDYSDALKGVVVLAQSYGDLKSQQGTKLLFADPSKPEEKNWATIVNLPQSVGGLHDGTISPCGRYYSAVLVVGTEDPKYPAEDLLMVDLVEKKIVKHVHAKHSSKDIEVLNVFSC